MLVLNRQKNESIIIDLRSVGLDIVKVLVVETRGDKARLGVEANSKIPIHRQEVFDAIERSNRSLPPGEGVKS